MLTQKQKKIIYDEIIGLGFDPNDFIMKKTESPHDKKMPEYLLSYKKTNYYFRFYLYNRKHCCEYSPAFDRLTITETPDTWGKQLICFVKWLGYLTEEIQTPDVWSKYYKASQEIDLGIKGDDNSPFTEDEIKFIGEKIEKVKIEINNLSILNEYKIKVNNELDYIFEESKKLGRKEWMAIFIGLLLQLAIPPDTILIIFKVIGQVFKNIFLK